MSDDSATTTPGGTIRRIIDQKIAAVRVCVDCQVVSYNREAQTVEVVVLVADPKVADGLRVWRAVPQMTVPVRWPSVSGMAITARIERGDRGVLHIRDRSHDEADSGQGLEQVKPASSRRWSYSDAFFSPVAYVADGAAHSSAGHPVFWLAAGRSLRVGSGSASVAVARADRVDARLDALETFAATHIHTGVTTGPGTTGTAAGAPSGSTTASTRLYTDG
jgi:hypothetical protein